MGARAINVAAGFWLFLSAFLWQHGPPQTLNAWVVSILIVTFAVAGLEERPRARYANFALGCWLVVSSFFLKSTTATVVNNVIVGAIVAVFASLPHLPQVRRFGHEPRTQS